MNNKPLTPYVLIPRKCKCGCGKSFRVLEGSASWYWSQYHTDEGPNKRMFVESPRRRGRPPKNKQIEDEEDYD